VFDCRAFTNAIDMPFDPDCLVKDEGVGNLKLTANQINNLQSKDKFEYLGVKGSTEESRIQLNKILTKLEPYYDYHGIDLRHCFEDFARHNNGIVTCSQFERSFPGKDTLSFSELKALTEYYVDPYLDGRLVNYLNFHLDINSVRAQRKCGGPDSANQFIENGTNTDGDRSCGDNTLGIHNLSITDPIDDQELRSVFDRLHVAIFKNRIRTTEFFRDHDKLRSGIITRNQFIRGLTLAQDGVQLGASLLTTYEINKIADFYSDSDGMVKYRKFCDRMENTFNIPPNPKQPTKQPT
jgi:hypothetical protein